MGRDGHNPQFNDLARFGTAPAQVFLWRCALPSPVCSACLTHSLGETCFRPLPPQHGCPLSMHSMRFPPPPVPAATQLNATLQASLLSHLVYLGGCQRRQRREALIALHRVGNQQSWGCLVWLHPPPSGWIRLNLDPVQSRIQHPAFI